MSGYRSPAAILEELGITEPEDLDIEAIAQSCGATIVYERLDGCAARILGNGDQAIITVDDRPHIGRKRFSAAHELGHWMRDRQKIRFSCTDRLMQSSWGTISAEQGANQYAADLLMPKAMFVPAAKNKPLTLETASELCGIFRTSLTATAIQLIRHGSFPGMLIYFLDGKRKWFMRGEDVPDSLWPHEVPHPSTFAAELLKGELDNAGPEGVQADGWLNHPQSRWYEVVEHSVRTSKTGILTMLWWKNEKQLLDLDPDSE
jgi:Zn-dependent peptidase ImmA (M78 family)